MDYQDYKGKPYWNLKETMHFLNCSRSTINRHLQKGELNPVRRGYSEKAHNLFEKNEVEKLIKPLEK